MDNRGVAFVTGASSGLGKGLALRLAKAGHPVGLSARRAGLLQEVAARIREEGGRAGVYPCDVSCREDLLESVGRCEGELGPIDLLLANAGMSINTRIDDFDAGAVEKVIRINLLGAVYATEGVLPGMLARGRGHLVAVSSLAGLGGLPMSAAYSASKGGMINFFESLRLDLKGTGVDVTVIMPGFIRTPMTDHNRHAMPFLMDLEPALDRMMGAILKRRKSLAFPIPLAALAWMARVLPRGAYDGLVGRVDRRKSPEAGGPEERAP
jgi:short-subunit dehydrogenase